MDILIKGLEMPKEGRLPLVIEPDGSVRIFIEGATDFVPCSSTAIQVPEHGELKDYNDILKIFGKVLPNVDDATNELLCDLLVQIMYAPTVIPPTVKIPTEGIEPKGVWDETLTTESEGERTT